jgi:hypothetical protein
MGETIQKHIRPTTDCLILTFNRAEPAVTGRYSPLYWFYLMFQPFRSQQIRGATLAPEAFQ